MKNQHHYSILVLALLMMGCSQNKPVLPRSEALLNTWQTQEVLQDIDGRSLSVYQKGRQANPINYAKARLTFQADGTYLEMTTTGNSYEGSWKLTENDQKLVLDGKQTYTINQLSASSLDITKTFIGLISKKTVIQQEKWTPL